MMFLMQEDNETFVCKAKDEEQAKEYASGWNAVVIRALTDQEEKEFNEQKD